MSGLRQFFSFFGSKVSLAKNYPAPKYQTIIEPFCGSAGYSCLYYDREIILSDADPTIVGIWKFLIRATKQDILSLPLDYQGVKKLSKSERDFIGFWWRRCGAVPSNQPVPWMLTGKWPHSFWSKETRERIARQVGEIKHWTCDLLSYEKYGDQEKLCTWFIDPPYQKEGKRYVFSSEEIDYDELRFWLKQRSGQKIICESMSAAWMDFKKLYENRTVKYKKSYRTIQEMICVC